MTPGSSIPVTVPPAGSTRMERSPASIKPSIACWLLPTSRAGASSSASSPNRRAAARSPGWHASPAWIATPLLAVVGNSSRATWPRLDGFGGRGPGGNGWRPTPRGAEGPGGVVGGRHGRGPGLLDQVGAPLAPHPPQGPGRQGRQTAGEDNAPLAARAGLLLAHQPQAAGPDARPPARSPVSLPDATATAVRTSGLARHQRRYEEEGVGGELQEPRAVVPAAGAGGL